MKKKRNGKITTVLLIALLVAGLGLLAYPSVSNFWNSMHQTKAIKSYIEEVSELNKNDLTDIWKEVEEYNRNILKRGNKYLPDESEKEKYTELLDVSGTGMMGYIDIPKISVTLPVYHGTDKGVLQVAAGHLDWTSLPAGGENTHCVLTGHRGLPSAKLFTDLDELEIGDTFILSVLDRTLTYEIDQILIVRPEEADALMISDGEDLCTLVTCTPYGINTHRILVRGHRITGDSQTAGSVKITSDAVKMGSLMVAPAVAVPILLVILIILFIKDKKRKTRQVNKNEENNE